MALVGVELETLVSEPDALTTRPLTHCVLSNQGNTLVKYVFCLDLFIL